MLIFTSACCWLVCAFAAALCLTERLWEGYYLGAFGDYILQDVLEADFKTCASSKGATKTGCLSLATYNLVELGIGAEPTAEDQDEEDDEIQDGFTRRRLLHTTGAGTGAEPRTQGEQG
jgi:hypothetical protein